MNVCVYVVCILCIVHDIHQERGMGRKRSMNYEKCLGFLFSAGIVDDFLSRGAERISQSHQLSNYIDSSREKGYGVKERELRSFLCVYYIFIYTYRHFHSPLVDSISRRRKRGKGKGEFRAKLNRAHNLQLILLSTNK